MKLPRLANFLAKQAPLGWLTRRHRARLCIMPEGISPHPVPLPLGEGPVSRTPCPVQASLLPWGEGQDEGRSLRSSAVRWDILRTPLSRSGAVRMVTLLASGALLGKLLGFARELLMARVFGASLIADSFRGSGTAVMMPLIPMQNEGVPAVMIPMHRAWQKKAARRNVSRRFAQGSTGIAALIALAIEASGSWWVSLIVGAHGAGGSGASRLVRPRHGVVDAGVGAAQLPVRSRDRHRPLARRRATAHGAQRLRHDWHRPLRRHRQAAVLAGAFRPVLQSARRLGHMDAVAGRHARPQGPAPGT